MHIFSTGPTNSETNRNLPSPGKKRRLEENEITFERRPIESLYSPEIEVNNPQTTPTKIDLTASTSKAGHTSAGDGSPGPMSSIVNAISSFFAGKALSPDKRASKEKENAKGQSSH